MFWRESQTATGRLGRVSEFQSERERDLRVWSRTYLRRSVTSTTFVRAGGEYGKRRWGVQSAYVGSFLEENIPSMTYDNPFLPHSTGGPCGREQSHDRTHDVVSEQSSQLSGFCRRCNLGKYLRSVEHHPWLVESKRRFLPYTTNRAITDAAECRDVLHHYGVAARSEPWMAASKLWP